MRSRFKRLDIVTGKKSFDDLSTSDLHGLERLCLAEDERRKQGQVARLLRQLERLPERERTIVSQHFGIGRPEMSLSQIASCQGVTRQRVQQIKQSGLKRLCEEVDTDDKY